MTTVGDDFVPVPSEAQALRALGPIELNPEIPEPTYSKAQRTRFLELYRELQKPETFRMLDGVKLVRPNERGKFYLQVLRDYVERLDSQIPNDDQLYYILQLNHLLQVSWNERMASIMQADREAKAEARKVFLPRKQALDAILRPPMIVPAKASKKTVAREETSDEEMAAL